MSVHLEQGDSEPVGDVEPLPPLLGQVRVLEWAGGAAAPYTGRILADLGADVVKLEPLVGESSRGSSAGKSISGLFQHTNAGKRSIAIDWDDPLGMEVAMRAVRWANCLLLDHESPLIESPDLLGSVSRDTAIVVITPYGTDGGAGSLKLGAHGVFHAGGEGFRTPQGTASTVPPVAPSCSLALFDAGVAGAFAVLMFVLARLRVPRGEDTGRAMMFDIASREVQIAFGRQDLARYPNEGQIEGRSVEHGPFLGLVLRTCDGAITTHIADAQWPSWCEMVGRPELIADPLFETKELRSENQSQVATELQKWTLERSKFEIQEVAQGRNLPVAAVLSPREVLADDQLNFRRFFSPVESPGRAAAVLAASLPFMTAKRERWLPHKLGPAVGEDTTNFMVSLGYAPVEIETMRSRGILL